ncbi:galactose-specific lectin nattectin-like [Danio aesculapii]|uniref:galactose-specific lectin nattectin-like n=1 Tax=Danio aesculapii TaxID=1142201 RepID=UPI0024BF87AD|nr:galactose-specific lectin nattectin-like [Danio aesculapii]
MAMLRNLLLLFIMSSMGNAEINLVERCPYGWTNFGVRCYKFFSESVNWVTAERNCERLGAKLASSTNKAENDFLLSLVPSNTHTWIGSHDAEQEGQWLWNDGSAFDYTNWCSGQPDNSGVENCLEISFTSNHCWNDVSCSTSSSYICATD